MSTRRTGSPAGSVFVGIFGMLVTAAIFGEAAVRDVQAGMDPLLFTSPLRKAEYLGGRFLGSLAVNAVVVLAIPLGSLPPRGWRDPSKQSAPSASSRTCSRSSSSLLPNLAVAGAILFTIGMLARQVVPVYLGAIGLFIGYVVALNYADRIESPMLAALADPLGIATLHGTDALLDGGRAEHAARRLSRGAGVEPDGLACGRGGRARAAPPQVPVRAPGGEGGRREAAASHRRCRARAGQAGGRPARRRHVRIPDEGAADARRRSHSLEEIAASRWFAVALLVCDGPHAALGLERGRHRLRHVHVAGHAPRRRYGPDRPDDPIIYLLIAVYAGELVWKDRDVGVAEIADAAPVPEGVGCSAGSCRSSPCSRCSRPCSWRRHPASGAPGLLPTSSSASTSASSSD